MNRSFVNTICIGAALGIGIALSGKLPERSTMEQPDPWKDDISFVEAFEPSSIADLSLPPQKSPPKPAPQPRRAAVVAPVTEAPPPGPALSTFNDLDKAIAAAKSAGKWILVVLSPAGCERCAIFHRDVLGNAHAAKALAANYVLADLAVEKYTDLADQSLAELPVSERRTAGNPICIVANPVTLNGQPFLPPVEPADFLVALQIQQAKVLTMKGR